MELFDSADSLIIAAWNILSLTCSAMLWWDIDKKMKIHKTR